MQLQIAERIRIQGSVAPGDQPSEAELLSAYERATDRMRGEVTSTEGSALLADSACQFLLRLLSDPLMSLAAQELLRQGAVLCWSALEVVVRDVFIAHINSRPMAVGPLLKDGNTKNLFPLKELNLDVMERHGFDLSNNMGNLLAAINDVSNLANMKDVMNILFPDAGDLRDAIGDNRLWLLFQRRHLIVHNRAVVDDKYIANTGDCQRIGERLILHPDETELNLSLIRDVGIALFSAVANVMSDGPGPKPSNLRPPNTTARVVSE